MLRERVTTAGRATEILKDLVAIESVNPFYPGGERGEVAMTAYVAGFFDRLGLRPERQEALPGRENVFARLDAPGATRTLLLESHMDTVTLEPVGRADFPDTLVPRMTRVQGLVAAQRGDAELAALRLEEAASGWRRRVQPRSGDRLTSMLADFGRPVLGLVDPERELEHVLADLRSLEAVV